MCDKNKEDEDSNWMRAGYDPYWSELAQNDAEFAEMMKEEDPEQYYSWSWTQNGPDESSE